MGAVRLGLGDGDGGGGWVVGRDGDGDGAGVGFRVWDGGGVGFAVGEKDISLVFSYSDDDEDNADFERGERGRCTWLCWLLREKCVPR